MKKNNLAIPTIIAVTVAVSILVALSATASSDVIDVGPGEFYTTIQAAIDAAGEGDTIEQKLDLPENAVEVSPGVFYLGESMDKGKVLEGYVFVHYAKPAAKSKPEWDDTVDLYKFMFGGIKWADTMQYEVNHTGSGLTEKEVLDALGHQNPK